MALYAWSFILIASCADKSSAIDASRRAALKSLAFTARPAAAAPLDKRPAAAAPLDAALSRRAALTLAFSAAAPLPAAAAPLDAALSLRADALRPLAGATCTAPATPPWLEGEYTVAASRFEGVSFPRGGAAPRQTAPGSRKGTLLLLPNVGANPRGYARAFDAALDGADARNAAATLKAFWPEASAATTTSSAGRTTLEFAAPTVSRGDQPQRIVAERLACAAEEPAPRSLVFAERVAQASGIVGDESLGLAGSWSAWHRYDAVDGGVREKLRVAVFDDRDVAGADERPLVVLEYAFFLKRK